MFLFLMHPYSFVIAGFLYIGWLSIILGVFAASHINLNQELTSLGLREA